MDKIQIVKMTQGFIITLALLAIVYDIPLGVNKYRGDTISEVIARWSEVAWTIPMIFGVLVGHFFWTVDYQPDNWLPRMIALFVIVASVGVANLIVGLTIGWISPAWFRMSMVGAGVILGHYLWGIDIVKPI